MPFGHTRLSIMDPAGGKQPLISETGASAMVHNGEIYNFIELRRELEQFGYGFHSQSDTEVLLAAYAQWGTECLERLNGMFAFALFDAPRQQLFLARDRAGEKPLFYYKVDDQLYFSSELKALLSNPQLKCCRWF